MDVLTEAYDELATKIENVFTAMGNISMDQGVFTFACQITNGDIAEPKQLLDAVMEPMANIRALSPRLLMLFLLSIVHFEILTAKEVQAAAEAEIDPVATLKKLKETLLSINPKGDNYEQR